MAGGKEGRVSGRNKTEEESADGGQEGNGTRNDSAIADVEEGWLVFPGG